MTLRAQFTVARGDFTLALDLELEGVTAVMGPRGAGKTTLLYALLGAVRPREGKIVLGARTLFDERGVDLPPEERHVAYVPRGLGLRPDERALEAVAFARRRGSARERRSAALDHLGAVELVGASDLRASKLAPEDRLGVAFARAMASEPRLLLFDDPLGGLDPAARADARRRLADWLHGARLPALVVTDEPADALEIAPSLLVLEAGRAVAHGPLEEVAVQPSTEFLAALMPALIEPPSFSVPPSTFVSEDE
ncbi:MAG: ATP-binding cassette domain-containing protein [Sandaracinaceae bacterium]|nr:ATP-binding cassette domain-containing protein [Sandaracinaceae bacterium]